MRLSRILMFMMMLSVVFTFGQCKKKIPFAEAPPPAEEDILPYAARYRLEPSARKEMLEIKKDGTLLLYRADLKEPIEGRVRMNEKLLSFYFKKIEPNKPTGTFLLEDFGSDGFSWRGVWLGDIRILRRLPP